MTRGAAIKTLLAVLGSRVAAAERPASEPVASGVLPNDFPNTYARLALPPRQVPDQITFVFGHKRIQFQIEGRTFTFTAKELADALEGK